MRNLTTSTIVLFPAGGAAPIILPPSRAVTTRQIRERLILPNHPVSRHPFGEFVASRRLTEQELRDYQIEPVN